MINSLMMMIIKKLQKTVHREDRVYKQEKLISQEEEDNRNFIQ